MKHFSGLKVLFTGNNKTFVLNIPDLPELSAAGSHESYPTCTVGYGDRKYGKRKNTLTQPCNTVGREHEESKFVG